MRPSGCCYSTTTSCTILIQYDTYHTVIFFLTDLLGFIYNPLSQEEGRRRPDRAYHLGEVEMWAPH